MTLFPGVVLASPEKGTLLRASSAAAQVITAATAAIITGSKILLTRDLVPGAKYKVRFAIDKTAAGTATSAYVVGIIPYGDAIDVANVDAFLTFTKIAGTAVADVGFVEIEMEFVAVGDVAEDGSVVGTFKMSHNLDITGHATTANIALRVSDASTATISAGNTVVGGTLCVAVTTGAADVSSIYLAEAVLEIPAAA